MFAAPASTPAPPTRAVQTAPPVGRPFHQTIQTVDGAFSVTLDVTPNHAGNNLFTASVVDNHTKQPATSVTVTLYITMQDMAMGTTSIVLQAATGGQFSATSDNFSMDGDWAIGISIQTPDHVQHKAGVNLVVTL